MSIFYVPNNALDAWDASMNKPDASMNKPEPCGGAWERPPTAMCEPQGPHVRTSGSPCAHTVRLCDCGSATPAGQTGMSGHKPDEDSYFQGTYISTHIL